MSRTAVALVAIALMVGLALGVAYTQGGREVYVANKCQNCHVVKGEGWDCRPELTHIGSGYTADKLAAQIRNPLSFNAQASMPAFDKPSDADLKALIAYLLTLK